MKKFLLSLIIAGALVMAQSETKAQAFKMYATNSTSGVDSCRCNGTTANYLYINPKSAYRNGSFQANFVRYTASMTGTAVLQGSNDGTNWVSASVNTGDTITVSNAATATGAIKLLPATGLLYQFYRLKCVNSSGDTTSMKAYFNGRQ